MSATMKSADSLQQKFSRLSAQWRDETAHMSLAAQRAMHPAYQHIIGIGPDAVPLLLQQLQQGPNDWFWALNAITEADPVPEASQGNLQEMANAWIEWGRSEGYLE